MQQHPCVGAAHAGIEQFVVSVGCGGGGAFGGDGGQVFFAQVDHERGGQVVGAGQRRGGCCAGRLPVDAGFADEAGDHRGQRPELAVPVGVSGSVYSGVQVRQGGWLALVVSGIDAREQRRGQERIADGEDARAFAVAVQARSVVG